MAGFKLPRIENALWRDPVATFQIKRHGDPDGQLQTWRVDLAHGSAVCTSERPLRPRTPQLRWNERPVAAELARLIQSGEDDPRLRWRDDRRREVKVITTKALPPGSPRATSDQATRLRTALTTELGDEWTRQMGWWVRAEVS